MSKDNNNIPTSELIDWYNSERTAFADLQERLNYLLANRKGPETGGNDIERVAGQLQGRREMLNSFAAFMIVNSAESAGEIQVLNSGD